jgi:ActR/RegA family two-component response regulator
MPVLGANRKVLIVNDEKTISQTLAAIFMKRGYEPKMRIRLSKRLK